MGHKCTTQPMDSSNAYHKHDHAHTITGQSTLMVMMTVGNMTAAAPRPDTRLIVQASKPPLDLGRKGPTHCPRRTESKVLYREGKQETNVRPEIVKRSLMAGSLAMELHLHIWGQSHRAGAQHPAKLVITVRLFAARDNICF